MLIDFKGFGEDIADLLCDREHITAVSQTVEQDNELVTPQSCDQVALSHLFFDSSRYQLQQPVSNLMAVAFVNIGESVNVDAEKGYDVFRIPGPARWSSWPDHGRSSCWGLP